MKSHTFPLAVVILTLTGYVVAHPGMANSIHRTQIARATTPPPLIGDLVDLAESELTATGRTIRDLLLGKGPFENLNETYAIPGDLGSDACARDKCCVWAHISNDLSAAMIGDAGRCNDFARGAVRLGFHDAGTWSLGTGKPGGAGGATGSVVLAGECEDRADNDGLEETCKLIRGYFDEYKEYGISMADLIQTASNVATVTCPLGPRVRTFVGREDVAEPAPTGLLPAGDDDADTLIPLFEDKTISPAALVALVGAHTTSQQRFLDADRAGDPQDSTPGVWDVNFYGETSAETAPEQVFRFPSDESLARDSRTRGTWTAFDAGNNGQFPWNNAYARAYIRLSLLGVYKINDLTECTEVLPPRRGAFSNPDQERLDRFFQGLSDDIERAADTLRAGNTLVRI